MHDTIIPISSVSHLMTRLAITYLRTDPSKYRLTSEKGNTRYTTWKQRPKQLTYGKKTSFQVVHKLPTITYFLKYKPGVYFSHNTTLYLCGVYLRELLFEVIQHTTTMSVVKVLPVLDLLCSSQRA